MPTVTQPGSGRAEAKLRSRSRLTSSKAMPWTVSPSVLSVRGKVFWSRLQAAGLQAGSGVHCKGTCWSSRVF